MPSADEDLRVLQACLTGGASERDAFARHFTPLVASVVRDPDLSQDVFVALFVDDCLKLRKFDPAKGSPGAWIGMIARQTAAGAYRNRKKEGSLPTALQVHLQASPPAEDLESVRAAIATLPAREALCLALLVQQGLGARDVAAILGIRRQNVYPIRDRALATLHRILGKNGI